MPSIRDLVVELRRHTDRAPSEFVYEIIGHIMSSLRHGGAEELTPDSADELAHELAYVLTRNRHDEPFLFRFEEELLFTLMHLGEPAGENLRRSLLRALKRRPMSMSSRRFYEHLSKSNMSLESKSSKGGDKEEIEAALSAVQKIKLQGNERLLFFVGAGASKPAPSSIPTVNELLKELWKKSAGLETKPLEKLQLWCEQNQIQNIEEMLTAVTFSNFIIKNPKVHGLLNTVLYPQSDTLKGFSLREMDSVLLLDSMLNMFFSLLGGTMLRAPANDVHTSIARYFQNVQNGDVITTNYDICLEKSFVEANINYSCVIDSDAPCMVKLVKMHGSINWFYCETCQRVFLPSMKSVITSMSDQIPYPIVGMCPECNAPASQFIIPPVSRKYLTHPPIIEVWEAARLILEASQVIVVIGFSFANADDYIAKMLVNAVGQKKGKTVIVIDKDLAVIQRCLSYIKMHVHHFEEAKQFIALAGDAAKIAPQLVDRLLSAHEPSPPAVQAS